MKAFFSLIILSSSLLLVAGCAANTIELPDTAGCAKVLDEEVKGIVEPFIIEECTTACEDAGSAYASWECTENDNIRCVCA